MRLIRSGGISLWDWLSVCEQLGFALTRHGKQHDLLVRPLFRCVVVLWDATGGDLAFVFGVGDVAMETCQSTEGPVILRYLREYNIFGEAVTGFEGGHCDEDLGWNWEACRRENSKGNSELICNDLRV